MPIATVINGEHFAVHADHLNTPRRLTDRNGNPRWQWAYSGFGEVAPQSLTTATLPEVRFNLRYPGQVDDANGLFYNWHRFYQPATGLYTQVDPIGLQGGWNRFGHVGGNAISFSDRTGLWAGVDDAIFAGGGALAGIAGQGVSDWLSGNLSGWEDYVGSAIGGAAFGETLLYAGPVAAGLVGGAVANASKQGLKNLIHKQCGFNWTSLGVDTAVGGLTGFIPGRPRISGINSGRNSTSAIYKQMATKFRNGTVSSVTTATARKMFVGRAYDTAVPYGVAGGAAAGAIGGPLIPGYSDSCECKCRKTHKTTLT